MTDSRSDLVVVEPKRRSAAAILIKRVLQFMFLFLCLPWFLAFGIGRLIWGRSRSFQLTAEYLAVVPGMIGVYLRQAFFERTLSRCGPDCYFGWLSTPSMAQAEFGASVYIGRSCRIGFASIGDRAMIGDGAQILSGGREHGRAAEGVTSQEQPQSFRRVTIGAGAWIGANAVVMADVGDGAIVGAGAVVVKPIPPRTTAVGVPARVLGDLS
jgi:acetyltransferase-like isoleucine patch superfamily enzyme